MGRSRRPGPEPILGSRRRAGVRPDTPARTASSAGLAPAVRHAPATGWLAVVVVHAAVVLDDALVGTPTPHGSGGPTSRSTTPPTAPAPGRAATASAAPPTKARRPSAAVWIMVWVVAVAIFSGAVRACANERDSDPVPGASAPVATQDPISERPDLDPLPAAAPLPLTWQLTMETERLASSLDGSRADGRQAVLGEETWVVGIGEYDEALSGLLAVGAADGAELWRVDLSGALCADEDGYGEIVCLDAPSGQLGGGGGASSSLTLTTVEIATGAVSSHPVNLTGVRSLHRTSSGVLVYSDIATGGPQITLLSLTGEVLWSSDVTSGAEETNLSDREVYSLTWLELGDGVVALTSYGAFLLLSPTEGVLAPPTTCRNPATDGTVILCQAYRGDSGILAHDRTGEEVWWLEGASLKPAYFDLVAPALAESPYEPAGEPELLLALDWATGKELGEGAEGVVVSDDPDAYGWAAGSPQSPFLLEGWLEQPYTTRLTALDAAGRQRWDITVEAMVQQNPLAVVSSSGDPLVLLAVGDDLAVIDDESGTVLAVYEDTSGRVVPAPSGLAHLTSWGLSRSDVL
ncbi:outer membrane protein assembly factor BamB family protein [Salana multivorans]